MGRPFYAVIIPLGDSPDQGLPRPPRPGRPGHRPDQGFNPDYPDQGLPGSPDYPDHGFNPDYPNQGLPGRPDYPSQGPVRPGRPVDPGFGWGGGERPGHPIAPGGRPGGRPDQGFNPNHPDQGLPPELGGPVGPVHPWVPPVGDELPPPPADIADQVVVAVWRPGNQAWSVAVGEGPSPAPTD
jgi:hypothetical protein